MASAIDPTKPVDGVPAIKADLRQNLEAAKSEIEALQGSKADIEHSHPDFDGAATAGFVPDPGSEDGRFLRDDGSWEFPSGAVTSVFGLTGSVDITNLPQEPSVVNADWLVLERAAGGSRKVQVVTLLRSDAGKFARSVSNATAITADAALDQTIQLLRGTSPITITLSETAGANKQMVFVKETNQPITVDVAGAATYRLPGDDDTLTRTTSFEITGAVALIGDGSTWLVFGSTNHETIWQADVNANGSLVYGNLAAQAPASGSMAGAPSGRTVFLTGNVTAVPIAAGWHQTMRNRSGSNKTITPASGNCIKTKDGSTAASVTLGNNKACFVEGDGVDLFVDGDVS
jgi:hypothetical protein